ncbi:aconitate hydratase AcnA [Vulcanisaeta thermophila]|uniref:aconitate hydratase AcnA n=1 Tax=Vulcanisaeta thermophila TaxID=867917 RepID=UPI000AF2F078|nr:aconitate hydratase AcnA [Vulcanisaeta thermophila]
MSRSLPNPWNTLSTMEVGGVKVRYYSLKALERAGFDVSRFPYVIKVFIENMLRNFDGQSITEEDIENILKWSPKNPGTREVPIKVARVLMQDYTGVPALVDLAVMREVVAKYGLDPRVINPQVPTDLVIDHSVQVDYWGTPNALRLNIKLEVERNRERYEFLKWAQNAFRNFRVFPPGTGIIHQVHLEHIARVVMTEDLGPGEKLAYFDTVVGMDSHTTMINGLGVVGWGVGGVEAEAALLGQPIALPPPQVVGVHLYGKPRPGVTATDIVLYITETLRKYNVVDKFVEFFGEGVAALPVPDRATIANMAPEYGATTGLFPVDEQTLAYLRLTGRDEWLISLVERYYVEQGVFGSPREGDVEYSQVINIDLSDVEPSVSGPSLPWQRRRLGEVPKSLEPIIEDRNRKRNISGRKKVVIEIDGRKVELEDGFVAIAAITSCTNTSNPYLLMAAGLVAKRAVELGISPPPYVKTSLAPGSRVVEEYLRRAGLLQYLEKIGFAIVGFGCTTCIGNSGPLPEPVARAIRENDLVAAAVLSGNRNFENRVHPDVRANYLASPPLVVIYALAGTVNKDITREPITTTPSGKPVYLSDLWPSDEEVREYVNKYVTKDEFVEKYTRIGDLVPDEWNQLKAPSGDLYQWDPKNTYIRRPPFFDDFDPDRLVEVRDIRGARALLILGDSITTDHISPAGSIPADSPAGKYLMSLGVKPQEFNTFGARRGNWEVMVRGAFWNKGVRNRMGGKVLEGGYTVHWPDGQLMTVFDAAMRYKEEGTPLIILAGSTYGAGSSRDWAAKGPKLLGVKAVIAKSFERIHRSNLVEMGILPLQFMEGEDAEKLGITGEETFDIVGLSQGLKPRQTVELVIHKPDGREIRTKLLVRLDTQMEVQYFLNGGILQYVLRQIIRSHRKQQ